MSFGGRTRSNLALNHLSTGRSRASAENQLPTSPPLQHSACDNRHTCMQMQGRVLASPDPMDLGESSHADVSLLDRRFPELRSQLTAICRSLAGDAAEDVVQETYLTARKRFAQLRDPEALDGWLTTIAVRHCVDRHRRTRLFRERMPELLRRSTLTHSQRDLGFTELIESLPARQRAVIVLHYGHGYSLAEIADILGLTHTNVRSIVFRGRRRLYAAWKEASDE